MSSLKEINIIKPKIKRVLDEAFETDLLLTNDGYLCDLK